MKAFFYFVFPSWHGGVNINNLNKKMDDKKRAIKCFTCNLLFCLWPYYYMNITKIYSLSRSDDNLS